MKIENNAINRFIIFAAILQVNELPASICILENIFSYPWHINTKYYTADINLCITNDRTIGNREFAKSVGAIVIAFDTNQVKHLVLFSVPYRNTFSILIFEAVLLNQQLFMLAFDPVI